MRHLARQFLRITLLVVAIGASGLNSYAAALVGFHAHAQGGHVHVAPDRGTQAHSHVHGVSANAGHAAADPVQADDEPASSGGLGKHMHAHCCGAPAVPPADYGLKFTSLPRQVVRSAASHLRLCERTSSLFRPPRATA